MGISRSRSKRGRSFVSTELMDYVHTYPPDQNRPDGAGQLNVWGAFPEGYGFRLTHDVIGDPANPYYPPHPFLSESFDGSPSMASGTRLSRFPSGDSQRANLAHAYVGMGGMEDWRSGHYTPINFPSGDPWDYLNRTIARANPNRPIVSGQNFLFELKDLGGRLPSLSSLPIAVMFGIAPFLGDLSSIYRGIMDIDKYVAKLNKMAKLGTLRSGGQLAMSTASRQFTSSTGLLGHSIATQQETTRRVWFSSVVDLGNNRLVPPKQFSESAALKKVMTQDNATAIWNALPWSWALDWLVDVGSFVEANWQNTSASKISSLCVMIQTTSQFKDMRGSNNLFSQITKEFDVRYGTATRITRLRHVFGNPIPNALFMNPGLTGLSGKLAIAGALGLAFSSRIKVEKHKYTGPDDVQLTQLRVKYDNWVGTGGSPERFWELYRDGHWG